MMHDIGLLRDFSSMMEWEGGFELLARHGHNGSGDDKLDTLMEKLHVILEQLDERWARLNAEFDLESPEEEEDYVDYDDEDDEDE